MAEAAPVLPPERCVEFDEENHIYYVDGESWPSVTQILKMEGVIDDRWFTEFGRWRGSAAHRATQLLDENRLDPKSVADEIRGYVKAWAAFRKTTKFRPALIEQYVWSDSYRYCGTLDRTGVFAGQEPEAAALLIDIKTYTPQPWAALQLAGYGRAVEPTQVFRRLAVQLKGDGTYELCEFPMEEYLSDVNVFLGMVGSVRWKQLHS